MSYKWPNLRLFNRGANTAGFSACIVQIFKAPGKKSCSHCNIKEAKKSKQFCISFARFSRRLSCKWCSCSASRRCQLPKVYRCLGVTLATSATPGPPGSVRCVPPRAPKLAWGPGNLASLEPVLFIWVIFSYYNALISFSQQVLIKPLPSTKHIYRFWRHSYE